MGCLQVDKNGRFQESSFQKAIAAVGVGLSSKKGKEKKQLEHGETSEIFKLVRLLMERNLHPVRLSQSSAILVT
jgi:hypothetical protein